MHSHFYFINNYLSILLSSNYIAKNKKVFIIILAEYLEFANIFIKTLIAILSKYIEINNYAINLKKDK